MAVYDQEIVDLTPQYLQTKSYSAQRFRTWFSDIAQQGVFTDTDFVLSLLGGLAYRMSAGKAWVLGQQVADQGMYRVSSLANADLALPAGHATLPRLDQVIIRVMDNTHDGSGFNEARIEGVPGTATAGATLDNRNGAANLTLLGEASKNVLLCYDVLMPAAASSISAGNVRRRAQLARLGFGTFTRTVPYLTVAQFQAIRDFPDGMEVIVVADATNHVLWRLRYNSSIGDAYKWINMGGSYLISQGIVASAANGAPIDSGLTITIPLSGIYEVSGSASYSNTYQNGGYINGAISENTTDFVTSVDGLIHNNNEGSTFYGSPAILPLRRTATIGNTFRWKAGGFPGAVGGNGQLQARPIRVSQ